MATPSPHRRATATPLGRATLLGSVFVVAACGLVYELVAASVSSYLLGDAVTQFSLVIGVFLSAMGIGSWLARFVQRNLLRRFVEIEIWIGVLGGLSSLIMFGVGAFLSTAFTPIFYGLCIAIGILVGLEIPILIRILKEEGDLSEALSNTLALDYLGALAGSVLFPMLALPWLGISRASVVFGLLNLAVAGIGVSLLPERRLGLWIRVGVATTLLGVCFLASGRVVGFFEDFLYDDDIVFAKASPYQRVVITRWRNDVRLFIDGNIQFSSIDEQRYHEPLVIPAMEAHGRPKNVLVLGGGDGLAAREILAYPSVERVQIVDLDPLITELATTRPELVALNQDALRDPRVRIENNDAMLFLEQNEQFWDVIIIDLPDPNNRTLAKLYSDSFYALVARRLSQRGVVVTQASSPYFSRDAFWCIAETMGAVHSGAAPLHVYPYHGHVPSFGEWGWVMASRTPLDPKALKLSVSTDLLTDETLSGMFDFPRDLTRPEGLRVNSLDDPVLYGYYEAGWRQFNE